MSNLRTTLLKCIDPILNIKEQIGADIEKVDFVTRTWTGTRPGDGSFSDDIERVNPLPCIKDVSHDVRLRESGTVKQGDLFLIGLSQNTYPDEEKLRTDTDINNVEKFFKIGVHFYRTIHIRKRLITWDIQVRKVLNDETE